MAKSILIALSAIAGVAAGVAIEKKTNWFGRSSNNATNVNKKNMKKIDAQIANGGGLTNEAATGNND